MLEESGCLTHSGLALPEVGRGLDGVDQPAGTSLPSYPIPGWKTVHEIPGRIRLRNPALDWRKDLCRSLEDEMGKAPGVTSCSANHFTSTVVVHFDNGSMGKLQVLSLLASALEKVRKRVRGSDPGAHQGPEEPLHSGKPDDRPENLAAGTAALALAAVGQYAVPALLPVSSLAYLYTSAPGIKKAWDLALKKRRIGAGVIDALLFTCCLASGEIFAGAFMAWCLTAGRKLMKSTRGNVRQMAMTLFGSQPIFARVVHEGLEEEVPVAQITPSDIVSVKSGELIPADGIIVQGLAIVDEHLLTGGLSPTDKGVGDRVYASSVMVAGEIYFKVEKTGSDTACSQICRIIGENLEAASIDCAESEPETSGSPTFAPTLALGALAAGTVGLSGAMAVVGSGLNSGSDVSRPFSTAPFVYQCMQQGILVKDWHALDAMAEVDTVLFDHAALLADERCVIDLVPGKGEALSAPAIDGAMNGAVELRASLRPGISEVIGELRKRGIRHVAILSGQEERCVGELAEMLGMDRCFAPVRHEEDKVRCVELLRSEGKKVCFVGDGVGSASAGGVASVFVSLRDTSTIAVDNGQIVLLRDDLSGLCELGDVAGERALNIRRGRTMALVPNALCVFGVFALGFGLWHAILLNSVSTLASFVNGMLPMRKVMETQADRALDRELFSFGQRGSILR